MSNFLLVPTNVQAFLVGTPGDEKIYNPASVPQTESDVARWYVGKNTFSFLNPTYQCKKLDTGIHLHWALPAGLLHSRHAGQDTPAQQPCIPNRWLVLRMWHAPRSSAISSKAWIVESDYISRKPDSGGTPFPFVGTNPPADLAGNHCGYVGRTVPAKSWSETHPAYRFDLKSYGWGDPTFAAFYPACKGVLGFHDPLGTEAEVRTNDVLTYLVLGWYSDFASDASRDPLLTLGMEALGWSSSKPGTRTLCHGNVAGITWQGANHLYPAAPPAESATVAIGGSAAEALAALLKPGERQKPLQQVLCAFQHGQATQVSRQDQLSDLLHRQGFGAMPGGKQWVIEPVARTPDSPSPQPPLSDKLQLLLGNLNEKQRALDRHAGQIESLKARLFACWATWASRQTGPPHGRPKREVVDAAANALSQAVKALEQYQSAVNICQNEVITELLPEKQKLAESAMPPFLYPKEPFVVLSSDNLVGIDRFRVVSPSPLGPTAPGAPEKDRVLAERPLLCRPADGVVTGVDLTGRVVQPLKALDYFQLSDIPNPAGLGELARSLALESLLLDPLCAVPFQDDDVIRLFRQLQNSLEQNRSDSHGNKLEWLGRPPGSLAVTPFGKSNPWLPVYLLWQAHWAPRYSAEMDTVEGWKFNPEKLEGDLVPSSGLAAPPVVSLEGATLIAPVSCKELAKSLRDFAEATGRRTGQVVNSIEQAQVLGQSLGGFNDLLLRQSVGLSLPPFDPTSKGSTADSPAQVDTKLWDQLGPLPQSVMPVAGTFLPMRAGALKLVNLWIIDSFGQTRKLVNSDPSSPAPAIVASALLPPPRSGYDAGFSPRLVQPTRLNFDWLPADHTAPGPVCGWVVPNYLEKSFAVFSANGDPLGTLESELPAFGLKTIDSRVTFRWRPIPGSGLAIENIADPRLRRFVALLGRFSADEGQAFLELVDLVLRRAEARAPADDPARAVLLGRPLALVYASLGLEVEGLPAGHWLTDGARWSFATEGIEKLRIPVRLGGVHLPADGLVGYIPENASWLVASDGAARRGNFVNLKYQPGRHPMPDEEELTVACADPHPVSMTLLMDAGAPVHATTGILPRLGVMLPREAAHRANLIPEIYVAVAPVLGERPPGNASQITMPQPSDAFGQWSWATRHNVTAKNWLDIRPADDRARFAGNLSLTEGWLRLRLDRSAPKVNDK